MINQFKSNHFYQNEFWLFSKSSHLSHFLLQTLREISVPGPCVTFLPPMTDNCHTCILLYHPQLNKWICYYVMAKLKIQITNKKENAPWKYYWFIWHAWQTLPINLACCFENFQINLKCYQSMSDLFGIFSEVDNKKSTP